MREAYEAYEAYEVYEAYEAYDVSESVTFHRREAERGSRELSSLAGFGVEPRSSPRSPSRSDKRARIRERSET